MKSKFFTLEEGKSILGKDVSLTNSDRLGPLQVDKGEIVAVAGYNTKEHEFELLTQENKDTFEHYGVHVRWHDAEREEETFGTLGKYYNKRDFEEECFLRPDSDDHFFDDELAFDLLGVAVRSKIDLKGRLLMGETISLPIGTQGIVTEVLQFDVSAGGWAPVRSAIEDDQPFKEEQYASVYKICIAWFEEENAFMSSVYDKEKFSDECEIVYEEA